ncbi:MAG: mechanosensitive ion channel family protein [Verrucomicrobiota bacterium]
MGKFEQPEFWVQVILVLVMSVLITTLTLRLLRLLGRRLRIKPSALKPFLLALRWVGGLMVLALVLKPFGTNVLDTILAALGLVAIGVIAVWSILSHITATILLILIKPFRVGDTIQFPGEEIKGVLVDLNLFFAILQDEEGNQYSIPTNTFFQKTVRRIKGEAKITLDDQFDAQNPYRPREK